MKRLFTTFLLLAAFIFGHATILQDKKFPKASTIYWIDLDKTKSNRGKTLRNVKVRAFIDKKDGRIKVLEYEKEPHVIIEKKINKCLKTFRVRQDWIASGKAKTGEQIVYLRFIDEY